jgi:hypothetical protein
MGPCARLSDAQCGYLSYHSKSPFPISHRQIKMLPPEADFVATAGCMGTHSGLSHQADSRNGTERFPAYGRRVSFHLIAACGAAVPIFGRR